MSKGQSWHAPLNTPVQQQSGTDYVRTGVLSNWNCHHSFLHLHSEAVVQIMHYDMWKGDRVEGNQSEGHKGEKTMARISWGVDEAWQVWNVF